MTTLIGYWLGKKKNNFDVVQVKLLFQYYKIILMYIKWFKDREDMNSKQNQHTMSKM